MPQSGDSECLTLFLLILMGFIRLVWSDHVYLGARSHVLLCYFGCTKSEPTPFWFKRTCGGQIPCPSPGMLTGSWAAPRGLSVWWPCEPPGTDGCCGREHSATLSPWTESAWSNLGNLDRRKMCERAKSWKTKQSDIDNFHGWATLTQWLQYICTLMSYSYSFIWFAKVMERFLVFNSHYLTYKIYHKWKYVDTIYIIHADPQWECCRPGYEPFPSLSSADRFLCRPCRAPAWSFCTGLLSPLSVCSQWPQSCRLPSVEQNREKTCKEVQLNKCRIVILSQGNHVATFQQFTLQIKQTLTLIFTADWLCSEKWISTFQHSPVTCCRAASNSNLVFTGLLNQKCHY